MENQFPIYLKAYDKWYIKLINENEVLEVKTSFKTVFDRETNTITKKHFTYNIESYHNDELVNQWLIDLQNPDEPDYIEVTKDEFVKNYFETVYKINEKLL